MLIKLSKWKQLLRLLDAITPQFVSSRFLVLGWVQTKSPYNFFSDSGDKKHVKLTELIFIICTFLNKTEQKKKDELKLNLLYDEGN